MFSKDGNVVRESINVGGARASIFVGGRRVRGATRCRVGPMLSLGGMVGYLSLVLDFIFLTSQILVEMESLMYVNVLVIEYPLKSFGA